MRYLIVLIVLSLSACSSLYITELPEGMVLTETYYTDQQELDKACGDKISVDGCAITDHKTYCNIHVGLAANGEPKANTRTEEIAHCIAGILHPVKRG